MIIFSERVAFLVEICYNTIQYLFFYGGHKKLYPVEYSEGDKNERKY